jgi:hypothetical protein
MYRPLGNKDARGFFESFEVAMYPEAWLTGSEAWSTPEQRAYNASTQTCPSCKGWGYQIQRRGKEVIRDNCGCQTCLGLGKVKRDE